MLAIIQTILHKSPDRRPECEQLLRLIGFGLPSSSKKRDSGAITESHAAPSPIKRMAVETATLRICTLGGDSFDIAEVPTTRTVRTLKNAIGSQKRITNPQRRIELFLAGGEDPLPPESKAIKSVTSGNVPTLFMCVREPFNDRAVLEEIFRLNNGHAWPTQRKDGWTVCDDVSLWANVTADADGNVIKLNFGELGCSDRHIERLPDSIGKLTFLEEISFLGCKLLPTLPASFSNLINLRTLGLSHSGITHLPDSLADCPRLQRLELRECKYLKSTVSLKAVMKQKRPACTVDWPN